ncbi:MAG: hypothetical protein AAF548_16930 [Actinomycetota bacterium]
MTIIEHINTAASAQHPSPLTPRSVATVVMISMIGGGVLAALAPPEPVPVPRGGAGPSADLDVTPTT